MLNLLRVENITARYDQEKILEGINFNIKSNEFTALLGLNGTGKTTLLKVICGLLKPQVGKCYIFNKDIYEFSEKERAKLISFLPQRHSIIYDTTVIEVVLMGITPYLGIFDSPSKKHRDMAYGMLEKMGMEAFAYENFLHLSEGQKQIVIIARNLMQNSSIMLFDEPDSALDFNNRNMVITKIRDVVKEEKRIGIITLHDPNTALSYCDRIIILKDKRITADFYTKDADHKSLLEVFTKIYDEIEIIEYKGKHIIMKL